MGTALGAGYRGVTGLRDTLAAQDYTPAVSTQLPQTLKLDQVAPAPEQEKLAGIDEFQNQLASKVAPYLPKMLGNSTTKPLLNSIGMPLSLAVGGSGIYGGYKLTDWLINKEKERNQKNQLDSAENDYRKALAEQYQSAMQAKQAGDDLGIDSLYELNTTREKEAGGGLLSRLTQPVTDYSGMAAGGLTSAMLLTALGTGKLTYDHVRGSNKQDVLAKALKRRQALRSRNSPPPILAEVPEQREAA